MLAAELTHLKGAASLRTPAMHVYDDIQDIAEELIVIENIMRQREVLESSLTLWQMTAKSVDAFSLQISHKGLENSKAQLR